MGYASVLLIAVVIGLTFILSSFPFFIWQIPQNDYWGIRFPKTMKPGNEKVWNKVNKFAAKLFTISGVIMLISGGLASLYLNSLSPVLCWYIGATNLLLCFATIVAIIIYTIKA